MPRSQTPRPSHPSDGGAEKPPGAMVGASLAGLVAASVAAGSAGLLTDSLRHALVWLALAVAVILLRPARSRWPRLGLGIAGVLLLPLILPTGPAYDVLAAGLIVALLAQAANGASRPALWVAAFAAAVLGIFRLACDSIATVWLIADGVGFGLGWVAGHISGRPLWIGSTFGGVDTLVLMLALVAGWFWATEPPRLGRATWALTAVAVGQLVYLVLLSLSADWLAALPKVIPPVPADPPVPPDWVWSDAVREILPWNMPVVAVAFQMVIAGVMFRSAQWRAGGELVRVSRHRGTCPDRVPLLASSSGKRKPLARHCLKQAVAHCGEKCELGIDLAAVVLAAVIPLVTILSLGKSDLSGKTIVGYRNSRLDWAKPQHDRYGWQHAGQLGMIEPLVESLGGKFRVSDGLAESDLAGADALVVIHPMGGWPADRLERVWEFVRRGGSLLVVAEPRVQEGSLGSSFNDVLEPTGLQVRFDVAIPKIERWEQSYQAIAHPATSGVGERRNRFGMVAASSIAAPWPAQPLVVGRWGWSDPGSDAALTGVCRYDAGERLGDLVLAAEAKLGAGRVVVLGDSFSLCNENVPDCHSFTGRLLGYLAGGSASPQVWWRQWLGGVACLGWIGLLAIRPSPGRLAVALAVLAVSLAASTAVAHHRARVLPDGRRGTWERTSRVASIDASHMDAYSDDNWSDDGIAGLKLTLMRNGYLPLLLPELTRERLERADMLILIAPLRPFSADERATVRAFVERGGMLIAMVGAEESAASRRLLNEFQLDVPPSPGAIGDTTTEPEPMGAIFTPYLDTGKYRCQMLLYSGWPVVDLGRDAEVIARGSKDQPVVMSRRLGQGRVVLIGDTGFAMNKFLEPMSGETVFGSHANADFWRWLLADLAGRPEWIPPPESAASAKASWAKPAGAAEAAAQEKKP